MSTDQAVKWGRPERRILLVMGSVIVGLHVVGWGAFVFAVSPAGSGAGNSHVFGIGLAIAAYTLGIRHAFDADHIAAIDNTTRRLMHATESRSISVGFWFALGHSSVVLAAVTLLTAGFSLLAGQMSDSQSVLTRTAGVWGALVSGVFLLLVGSVNLASFGGLWRIRSEARKGNIPEAELNDLLGRRGIVNRILAPLASTVDRPSKMYPIGVMFGLGFDTATTIGLLVLSGGAVLALPWYAAMVLPVLFTAGMVLCDTMDGLMMQRAYEWAFERTHRRITYNLLVTFASVVVAFLVAAVILVGALAETLKVSTGPLAWVSGINLQNVGLIVVGLFTVIWLTAWSLAKAPSRTGH